MITSRLRRIRMRPAAIVAVAAVIVLLLPGSASAHAIYKEINDIYGQTRGVVTVTNEHRTIQVCDTNPDAIGVYVEFYVSRPGHDDYYSTLSDTNGSAVGCPDFTASAGVISKFNGHWRKDGTSTGWINVT